MPNHRFHLVIHLIASLSHAVASPESRSFRIGEKVTIAHSEAFRNFRRIHVARRKVRGRRIVASEPQKGAHFARKASSRLCHEPETRLLGSYGPFVQVALAVHLEIHCPPAIRQGVSAGTHVGSHIHRSVLIVVAHHVGHVLNSDFTAWLHE